MSDKSRRFRMDVAPLTTVYDDQIIPNSKTWRIKSYFGSANYQGNCSVAVIFDRSGDNELLFSTYGCIEHSTSEDFVGDGVKKLSIRLKNNLSVNVVLLCEYIAEELE